MGHTDPRDDDHVPILPFAHHGQDGLDDVDVGEEVYLEDLIHKADSSNALCQLFNGSNDSYRVSGISSTSLLETELVPSLAAQSSTSIRPNASTASATAA